MESPKTVVAPTDTSPEAIDEFAAALVDWATQDGQPVAADVIVMAHEIAEAITAVAATSERADYEQQAKARQAK